MSKTTTHKKHLGQNFLTDARVVEEIVALSDLTAGSIVIEVGPGEGVLTAALAATGAHIWALEYDQDLIPALSARFADHPRVTIIHADIRTFHIAAFCEERGIDQYRVVANIPYYITSMIIRLFLESVSQPEQMTLMIQKEVAERICAAPGAMSKLAVSVQYYGVPRYERTVVRHAFDPVPEVDSAVISLREIGRRASLEEEKQFFRVVRAGFSAKRKTLANNLINSLHRERGEIEAVLASCGLTPTVRAQELSIAEWSALSEHLM